MALNQLAFFKSDGTIEVVDHPGQNVMEYNAFSRHFAEQLTNCFRVIVNDGRHIHIYAIVDGKVKF